MSRLERRIRALQQTVDRYSWLRVAVFVVGVVLTGLAAVFGERWVAAATAGVSVVAFSGAVYAYQQLEEGLTRHRLWHRHKATQVARLSLDWEDIPYLSIYEPRRGHPFEADLDIVGEYGLHRLLDTPISREGSERLRTWLTEPEPDLETVKTRQALVRELVPLSLFRDKLGLNATRSTGSRKIWEVHRLLDWLQRPQPQGSLQGWLWLAAGLAAVNWGLLAAYGLGLAPAWWQVSLPVYLGVVLLLSGRTSEIFHGVEELQASWQQLQHVFRQLERFSYARRPQLGRVCQPFTAPGRQPSRSTRQLVWLMSAVTLRNNPYVWLLLNTVVPWDLFFAGQLRRARARIAAYAPDWLAAWVEVEAASALANLAYLNPDYTFPTFTEGAVFEAEQAGHPLLPRAEKVKNDFRLAELGEVGLITGSNMAGKSTFLRTVGLNLALAYAGGPVDAASLRVRGLRLFTCIKVSDSVTDGISYFYAEVKRLKALLEELRRAHDLPLFFFIDEIFRGTNNRERLLGSQAYVQALTGQHGVGLISTHDLELASMAEAIPSMHNYHFRDEVQAGRMYFDYRLRPGPCPTTNALKIMAQEGLPVSSTLTVSGPRERID